jgi:hypothetical protein
MSKIVNQLQDLAVPVEGLTGLPLNPRRGNIEALKKSLGTFGQLKPIVFRVENDEQVVIAGNHTLQAARELGWDTVAAVDASDLTPEQAQAFALADNRIADLGRFDDDELIAFVKNAAITDPELWEAASFSNEEIQRMLESTTRDQFDGFLDDLATGEGLSWRDEEPLDINESDMVTLQVLVSADERRQVMARLKSLVDGGRFATTGEALVAVVASYA